MSEYIPITTDIRLLIGCFTTKLTDFERDKFNQLCDVLDSIHAQLERENESLKSELDRARGEWDYWESTHVELPKDAHDEHIFAGDRLDGYGKTIEVVELRYGRSGWVLISRDGNAYADTFAFTHNHAPTVEDVLREFVSEFNRDDTELCDEEIIERFAAKLRLAGDAE